MSFFNVNSLMIMIKPLLNGRIEEMEENGTLEKIQSDIQMIAHSNALPALSELIANLKEHNALLREIRELHYARLEPVASLAGPGNAGHVDVDGVRVPALSGPD